MAFGFPAYAEEVARYDCDRDDLMDAAERALDVLGWGGRPSGPWRLSGGTGISFWSWGETLTVEVSRNSSVRVRSQCVWPTQCFDWGRNQSNVNKFLDALDDALDWYQRRRRRRAAGDETDEPTPSRPPSRQPRDPGRVSDRPAAPPPPPPPRARPGPGDDAVTR